jgi:hypothetical protein
MGVSSRTLIYLSFVLIILWSLYSFSCIVLIEVGHHRQSELTKGGVIIATTSRDDDSTNSNSTKGQEPRARPENQPTAHRGPTFLWGIASTGSEIEARRRRKCIRNTYLSVFNYKNDDAARKHRICSLNDLIRGKLEHPENCQLAYAFFVDGNPSGTTKLVDFNDSYPLALDPSTSSILNNTEDDMVYLNVRETQFEGAMQTWFQYGVAVMQEHSLKLDYVVKADIDILLRKDEFFEFSHQFLPAQPQRVYAGPVNPNWENMVEADGKEFCGQRANLGTPRNQYIVGQVEILSADLAAYITSSTLNRTALAIPGSEDMPIGEFVCSHPKGVRVVTVNKTHNLWTHIPRNKQSAGQLCWKPWYKYQKESWLNRLGKDEPRFLLVDVKNSGSRELMDINCMSMTKTFAVACFEKFANTSRHELRVSKNTVSVLRDDTVTAVFDEIEATAQLWVLRHPLDRMVSYLYTNTPMPLKEARDSYRAPYKVFQKCYHSFNAWARDASMGESGTCPSEYETVAMERLKLFATEFRTSYQRFPSLPVFALRRDFLAQDLLDLETGYLGQERRSVVIDLAESQIDANETMQILALTNKPSLRRIGCCVLKDEILLYKDIVALALNLNEIEKKQSMLHLAIRCGVTSLDPLLRSCPEKLTKWIDFTESSSSDDDSLHTTNLAESSGSEDDDSPETT